jgi:hypothetical protein
MKAFLVLPGKVNVPITAKTLSSLIISPLTVSVKQLHHHDSHVQLARGGILKAR